MATSTRKLVLALFACLFAGCLAISLSACASQSAGEGGRDLASTSPTEQATDAEAANTNATSDDQTGENANAETSPEPADSGAEADTAATTATIMYYENVGYDDGDVEPDDEGRVLLGTYELKDVHVGQTLNAWDYVVDIPGYFFWDGWPQNLTLSENPDDNVIKLFYFKLWNNEYTVNYYLMVNADLSADNWKDALKPDDVKFIKMGSETFTDQRFDKLVKGDAQDKVEITDEMVENPVSKAEADYVKNVYETGLREGESLAQTGDRTALAVVAAIAMTAAVVAAIAFALHRRSQRKND